MRFLNWLVSSRYRRLQKMQAERHRRNAERENRRREELRKKLMEMYINAPTYREARQLLGLMIRNRY